MAFTINSGVPISPWVRWLVLFLLTILVSLAVLVKAGANRDPPVFAISASGAEIVPVDYPLWRKISDGLAGRKYALLTFDDGPYGGGTDEKILTILRRHRAHAIFFLVCGHLNNATAPVLGEIFKDGDIIANHSYSHPRLTTLSPDELSHQVEGCSDELARIAGIRPRYFRPPFGQASAKVRAVIRAAGMQEVLWSANSQDSWLTKPDQILYWSKEETDDGSILLMHDKPATAAVLDRVLTQLEQHGFQFVLPPR